MVSHARSNGTMSFPHYSKPKGSPDGEDQPQPETRVSKFVCVVDTFKFVQNLKNVQSSEKVACLHSCISSMKPLNHFETQIS